MSLWNLVRFFAIVGCFLLSLLVFYPAPNLPLFELKLVATEYGHWLALLAVILMVAGRRMTAMDSVSIVLAGLAAVMLISTSIRAIATGSKVRDGLQAAFPTTENPEKESGSPYSWSKLWGWGKPPIVTPEEVVFAHHSDAPLTLDFYPSRTRSSAPCVIVVHGGGWNSGSRKDSVALNHELSRRGYAVAAIDYRLAPKYTWPAQRDDTRAAIHYLQSHAEENGINPHMFVLLGRSAGGQIAEATTASGLEKDIRGCIAFYSPADMRFAYEHADGKDILNSEKLLREFLGGTPAEAPENYDSATANGQVSASTPPMLLLHGETDELVWFKQSERLDGRLSEVGAPHFLVRLPWATHAFDYNYNGPGGQISTWAVCKFLESVTR
ncbi:MAG: alpha/beta hydrolase [Chthoniobacteraceae bacterium]